MVKHIQQAEELISIVHVQPGSLRLWQLLLWLAHKFGRDVDQGRLIDLEVTHQELAESISTTRVSVTRFLQAIRVGWQTAAAKSAVDSFGDCENA